MSENPYTKMGNNRNMGDISFNRINPIGDSPHHGRDHQNSKRKKPKKEEQESEKNDENQDSFDISEAKKEVAAEKEKKEEAKSLPKSQGATLEWLNLQKQIPSELQADESSKIATAKKAHSDLYQDTAPEEKKSFEA